MDASEPGDLLSAEVVLRIPSGSASEPISSVNLAEHRPDPAQASRVRDWFQRSGFSVSEMHGISFTVTGSRELFASRWPASLDEDSQVGIETIELPLPADLPEDVAHEVEAVTFTPPPDFGPGSY